MTYDVEKMKEFQKSYDSLFQYATNHNLKNTLISLQILPCLLFSNTGEFQYKEDGITLEKYMKHALYTANLLVDVHPAFNEQEEDLALSVALCHVLVEKVKFEKNGQELTDMYHLDSKVNELIHVNLKDKTKSAKYYKRIQENKIALLVKLADRCYIVEQLPTHSIHQVRSYVYETKHKFFPMCIYGKEHYPDLYLAIGLLMEKMRTLTEVADILLTRFIERENVLNNEIISLQEENIRIRSLIQQLQEER